MTNSPWNDACSDWLVDFGTLPESERNAILWVVTDPRARERLPDWDFEVRDVVGRLRSAMASADPTDLRIRQISRRLRTADYAESGWSDHVVEEITFRRRRIRHPELGERTFQMVVLLLAGADELGVIVHLPVENPRP